jgi:hypothetical protein
MNRRKTAISTSRKRSHKETKSPTWWIFLCVIVALCAIGWFVYGLLSKPDYTFKRSDLDKYVVAMHHENILDDGAAVYVDMSDGMNYAYAKQEGQDILQSIINKLAAVDAIKFYGLANGEISPISLSHTQLYNYMMDGRNYQQQRAPIEKTLDEIIRKNQPALLMTDFEEYKGNVIEKAAYAKRDFIEWLAKGFNITFYKWDFVEGNIQKHMFVTVFDDNANRLNSLVSNAVLGLNPRIETYVLAGREFAYPTCSKYISLKKGGNYHNGNGEDIVTAVLEDGSSEAYYSYTKPFATANGTPGFFAPLDNLVGDFSEYYPLGVNWASAITNSKAMQEIGIKDEDVYKHLLSNLYVNFDAQDGYTITGIEARVFDVQDIARCISTMPSDSIDIETLNTIQPKEVNEFMIASMERTKDIQGNWQLISVDFDEQFDGNFSEAINQSDLLRVNIVISQAIPNIQSINSFFEWEGNPSLANSIRETLEASSSNPQGRIIYTYYLKAN